MPFGTTEERAATSPPPMKVAQPILGTDFIEPDRRRTALCLTGQVRTFALTRATIASWASNYFPSKAHVFMLANLKDSGKGGNALHHASELTFAGVGMYSFCFFVDDVSPRKFRMSVDFPALAHPSSSTCGAAATMPARCKV